MKTLEFDATTAKSIVASFDGKPEMLVQILQALIERFGWISDDAMRLLADELNLSRADVYGVVSYYHDFRTTPPGQHIVRICQAESCQAMGSRELTRHAKQSLQMDFPQTTPHTTLEAVYCLGNCACSPAVMIDGHTYGRVTPQRFDELIADLKDAAQ